MKSPSTLVRQNVQIGGQFRKQPIYVREHIPPHFENVPELVDQFLSVIHENWGIMDHPTELPAYALWRLNWIHPFVEGNGRFQNTFRSY